MEGWCSCDLQYFEIQYLGKIKQMKTERTYRIESCVVSLEEALQAQKHEADRVEVCINLESEGMTPPYHLVSMCCDRLSIPIRVMIRATEVGFAADSDAIVEMIRSINEFKHLPVEGFVFGVMKDHRIDQGTMEELIHQATPFPITFHKAIDHSDNIESDLKWLNQHPSVDTVLTSGGSVKAEEGIPRIQQMKSWFDREIMAAGKITPETLPDLDKALQLSWYHGRAIV